MIAVGITMMLLGATVSFQSTFWNACLIGFGFIIAGLGSQILKNMLLPKKPEFLVSKVGGFIDQKIKPKEKPKTKKPKQS